MTDPEEYPRPPYNSAGTGALGLLAFLVLGAYIAAVVSAVTTLVFGIGLRSGSYHGVAPPLSEGDRSFLLGVAVMSFLGTLGLYAWIVRGDIADAYQLASGGRVYNDLVERVRTRTRTNGIIVIVMLIVHGAFAWKACVP